MRIGPVAQLQWNILVLQNYSQLIDASNDVRLDVFVETGVNVGSAKNRTNAIIHGNASHCQRRDEILRPIVNAGQQMAVQVNHLQYYSARATGAKHRIKSKTDFHTYQGSPADNLATRLARTDNADDATAPYAT